MSQVKPIDSVPAGERLDALVAVEVMRWIHDPSAAPRERWAEPNGVKHFACKPYSSHLLPQFFLVEAEIEKRGLAHDYGNALVFETHPELQNSEGKPMYHFIFSQDEVIQLFRLINATPEQRCRAALWVVRHSKAGVVEWPRWSPEKEMELLNG